MTMWCVCTQARTKGHAVDTALDEQFATGRLYACIASRPGQCGRCDGYILEGKELEFYVSAALLVHCTATACRAVLMLGCCPEAAHLLKPFQYMLMMCMDVLCLMRVCGTDLQVKKLQRKKSKQ